MNLTVVTVTLIICVTLIIIVKEIATIFKTIESTENSRTFRYYLLFKPKGISYKGTYKGSCKEEDA